MRIVTKDGVRVESRAEMLLRMYPPGHDLTMLSRDTVIGLLNAERAKQADELQALRAEITALNGRTEILQYRIKNLLAQLPKEDGA